MRYDWDLSFISLLPVEWDLPFGIWLLQLMDKECYKDIEKIKTIGSTYMAAVGLVPTIGTKVGSTFFCQMDLFVWTLCLKCFLFRLKNQFMTIWAQLRTMLLRCLMSWMKSTTSHTMSLCWEWVSQGPQMQVESKFSGILFCIEYFGVFAQA